MKRMSYHRNTRFREMILFLPGAKCQQHWANIPPEKLDIPGLGNSDCPSNEVDYFKLGKIEEADVTPSLQADRGSCYDGYY